jgi:hypothetical protein
MQDTNQNYGPLKMQNCNNLDAVVNERIKKKKSTYIPLWHLQVGLIVYGGVDTETDLVVKPLFEALILKGSLQECMG